MKVLVVKCHDVEGAQCSDFAMIEVEEPMLADIQHRVKFAQELKIKDASFSSIDYRNWEPVFVAEEALTKLELKGKSKSLPKDWAVVDLACEDLDKLLEDSAIETEHMDSVHLTVTDDSFWWGAYPKYVSELVTTHAIGEKDLDLIFKALA